MNLAAVSAANEFHPRFLGPILDEVEVQEARVVLGTGETRDEFEEILLGTLLALVLALGEVDVIAMHLAVLLGGHHVEAVGRLHYHRGPRHTHLLQRELVQYVTLIQHRAEHVAAVRPAGEDVDVAVRRKLPKVEEGHHAVVGHEGVMVIARGHLVHGEVERIARYVWVGIEVPRPAHIPISIVHIRKDVHVRLEILPQSVGDDSVGDGVLRVSETAFKVARLVHVAENGRSQCVTFVREFPFRGVDGEVPVWQGDGWVDGLQGRLEDVLELGVLHQDAVAVVNMVGLAIGGVEVMEAEKIGDAMKFISIQCRAFGL